MRLGGCHAFTKQLANNHQLFQNPQCSWSYISALLTGPCIIFSFITCFWAHRVLTRRPWPHKYKRMRQCHEHTHSLGCSSSTQSTVHSVLPPPSFHLRHFSCHSWRQGYRESAYTCNHALWPNDSETCALTVHERFFISCVALHQTAASVFFFVFFLFFPPSRQINSIFNRLSAQWFSWKKTGSIKSISLFKGFTLLHPVLLIYPTSFSFLRSIS